MPLYISSYVVRSRALSPSRSWLLQLLLLISLHSCSALAYNWQNNLVPQLREATSDVFHTLYDAVNGHHMLSSQKDEAVDIAASLPFGKFRGGGLSATGRMNVGFGQELSRDVLRMPGDTQKQGDIEAGYEIVTGQSDMLPGMLGTLSRAGLLYAKDVLVGQVLREVTPLHIPDLNFREKTSVGSISVRLFNITLSDVVVTSSAIDLSATDGITIFASGVSANLTLQWHYKFSHLVHDHGSADIKVVDMQSGVRFALSAVNGTLSLGLLECGTFIDSLRISLHGGGGAWLYNLFAHAFSTKIKAAVETRVQEQVTAAVHKLDAFLQGLPREVEVDETSAIDVTLVGPPLVRNSFLTFGNRGEFVSPVNPFAFSETPPPMPAGDLCNDTHKMVSISLSAFVLNSAATVYYQAGLMRYYLTELPKEVPFKLNTRSWKFLLPQLFRQYPDRPMTLDFNASAPPSVSFSPQGAHVRATLSVFIGVIPEGQSESLRVVSLSAEVQLDSIVGIRGNNVTLALHFSDLQLSLNWSKVGRFPVSILQMMVRGVMKAVVIPLMNYDIRNGFPLPLLPGVILQDSEVRYADEYLLVCTDISYQDTRALSYMLQD